MLALTLSALGIHLLTSVATGEPSAAFTGNTLMVIGILLSMGVSVVTLMRSGRREPPVAEEMYKEFARTKALDENVQRIHDRIDKTQTSIKDLHHEMSKGFQDVERALGRVEGKQDSHNEG